MKTAFLVMLIGCNVSSVPNDATDAPFPYVNISCSEAHCTSVVCPDVGPCTCYWPPANPIRCDRPVGHLL